MSSIAYVGSELELFAAAANWKAYLSRQLQGYLGDSVLEVGAGLGTTTLNLCRRPHRRWVCLEPDPAMTATLQAKRDAGELPACCEVRAGTLADLPTDERFDSIIYIDVLEHIEDDRGELQRAAEHLAPQGRIVVLAPAHQFLFSPFDQSIGHFRRYNRAMLQAAAPTGLACERQKYLDTVGLLASLGNRFVLGSGMPTPRQIWTWDKLMVPVSRFLDPLLFFTLGKSILGVWRKP
ncbi:MAG: class I SAM-dependent methyltransferase [Planctomycetia bacterium]|nr:class I SAM-dependent methyltransferase [Planctomycetia bacterium]